jgi:protein-disulfide isomerase
MSKDSIQDKILPVMVVVLIGAAFALGMMWGKVQELEKDLTPSVQGDQILKTEEPTNLSDDQLEKAISTAAYVLGDENAPITVVEFTDYQCSWCKKFYTDQHKQIIIDYVDTGKARYIFQDKPSFQNSQIAAKTARCAGNQGKYLEMHDLLFDNVEEWSVGKAEEVFRGYAGDLGLDKVLFNECYASEEMDQKINESLNLASELNVGGTPTFFVNKEILVGAQPIENFVEIFDKVLGI